MARNIVVVGAKAAGKTSIVHRLLDEPMDFNTYRPTIDDCYNITWKLLDKKLLQIQFIDTASWNEFPAMQSLFIKMSHLVMVVYDVTTPDWLESLHSLVADVRKIKADADLVIVGNKCDKLTKDDCFAAKNLSDVLDSVGHVYTSALSQQGIVGLRQVIICSKSKLTEGCYTEINQVPKRKKLRKKSHGMIIALQLNKKRKSLTGGRKCSQGSMDDDRIQYEDVVNGNFDKMFKLTRPDGATRLSLDSNMPTQGSTLLETHHSVDPALGKLPRYSQLEYTIPLAGSRDGWHSSSSISEYSSPSLTSLGDRQLLGIPEEKERRNSLDFSRLEPVSDPLHHFPLKRHRSASCGDKDQLRQSHDDSSNDDERTSSDESSCRNMDIVPSPPPHSSHPKSLIYPAFRDDEWKGKDSDTGDGDSSSPSPRHMPGALEALMGSLSVGLNMRR